MRMKRGDPRGSALVSDVPIRYRDLELMLGDRGARVDHTTIFSWIQAYAAVLVVRRRLVHCEGTIRDRDALHEAGGTTDCSKHRLCPTEIEVFNGSRSTRIAR